MRAQGSFNPACRPLELRDSRNRRRAGRNLQLSAGTAASHGARGPSGGRLPPPRRRAGHGSAAVSAGPSLHGIHRCRCGASQGGQPKRGAHVGARPSSSLGGIEAAEPHRCVRSGSRLSLPPTGLATLRCRGGSKRPAALVGPPAHASPSAYHLVMSSGTGRQSGVASTYLPSLTLSILTLPDSRNGASLEKVTAERRPMSSSSVYLCETSVS